MNDMSKMLPSVSSRADGALQLNCYELYLYPVLRTDFHTRAQVKTQVEISLQNVSKRIARIVISPSTSGTFG